MKKLFVLMLNGKPKGICTPESFETKWTDVHQWWDEKREVEVPKDDYDKEKITISNIKNYL